MKQTGARPAAASATRDAEQAYSVGGKERGLSVGADDIVVMPFSVPKLTARIHVLGRRVRPRRVSTKLEQ